MRGNEIPLDPMTHWTALNLDHPSLMWGATLEFSCGCGEWLRFEQSAGELRGEAAAVECPRCQQEYYMVVKVATRSKHEAEMMSKA